MARKEHVLSVFVASPGDVEEERGKVEDVVRELNVAWSRELAVRLDLVRWETHAYPGMGIDAQDVINEQIPDDYDLFVGIMWCRYGTPTGRAGSGTVEEFERAKARYDADSSAVKLMVYFKDEPISPSRVDPSQLTKVNEFRDSLGDEGLLYWKFTGIDHFERLIRLHLIRQVQAWRARLELPDATVTAASAATGVGEDQIHEDDDDQGILDLMEIFETRFEELTSVSDRITHATEDIGQKMNDRSAEIENLPRDSQGNTNPKDAKRLITKAASDMAQYTARIEAELPLFRDAMNTGMNSFIRAATMSVDLSSNEDDAEQAKEGLDAIIELRRSLGSTKESTSEFRETIAALPRMTSHLNRAKRGVTSALDSLLDEFTNGETLLSEAEKVIRDLLGDSDDST